MKMEINTFPCDKYSPDAGKWWASYKLWPALGDKFVPSQYGGVFQGESQEEVFQKVLKQIQAQNNWVLRTLGQLRGQEQRRMDDTDFGCDRLELTTTGLCAAARKEIREQASLHGNYWRFAKLRESNERIEGRQTYRVTFIRDKQAA